MVDRIGKGGGVPPGAAPTTTGPARPQETGKTFDAQKPGAAPPAGQVGSITPSHALDDLKAGKIDFNQYLDLKVHEATGHLGTLSPVQLDTIRSMLRDRMATDPELVDLIKQATGHVPSSDE